MTILDYVFQKLCLSATLVIGLGDGQVTMWRDAIICIPISFTIGPCTISPSYILAKNFGVISKLIQINIIDDIKYDI